MRGLRDVARISGAEGADLQAICAMKEGLRLAQSIFWQPFEQMGFFNEFSRLLQADSEARKKPDSGARSGSPKAWILRAGKDGSERFCCTHPVSSWAGQARP
jgi:hypothetical protein